MGSSSLQAGAILIGAASEGSALKAQARFQQEQAYDNARLLDLQASEVEKQGTKQGNLYRRKVRGVIGSQRAALAAQGIDIGEGTAPEIFEESAKFAEEDIKQMRVNALREAFGLRTQAINMRAQGRYGRSAAKFQARNLLLTGGLQAAATLSAGAEKAAAGG